MSRSSDQIRATPLRGGRQNTGVCVLLEIGGARLLLDCGWENGQCDPEEIAKLTKDLVAAGGVDAVLISHPDFHHVGALPVILGRNGLQNVPVICTTPISKFSQLLLYDFVLNQQQEAQTNLPYYDLDDIDRAFSDVIKVKYNQQIAIPDTRGIGDNEYRQVVTVTAIPSGRTIGGTIWRIDCGPAEVLYAMDINLKRDLVVDAASLEHLPSSPALMITEGACVSRGAAAVAKRRKDKDEATLLINTILETVRAGGNVLIPCETAGRVLEILQILAKFWSDSKKGLYHLIFLSHMGHNVLELARSHLEWMSDSLNRDFYNGKANPFELPSLKVLPTAAQLEKKYPGPKVVLATEMSLNFGLSKELLLKWGGDPRSRVIYYDRPDTRSLATTLQDLSHRPPIIVSLSRPVRVPLTGQELIDFRAKEDKERKALEEAHLRQKRQRELAEFQVGSLESVLDEDDEADMMLVGGKRSFSAATAGSGGGAGAGADMAAANAANFTEVVAKKLRTSAIAKYLNSSFAMFESQLPVVLKQDEYGMSNDDLVFRDIQATESRFALREPRTGAIAGGARGRLAQQTGAGLPSGEGVESSTDGAVRGGGTQGNGAMTQRALSAVSSSSALVVPPIQNNPHKLVAVTEKVQFTCDFKEFNLAGRLDFKAMKALLQKVAPVRLLVLRGSEADCDRLVNHAKTMHQHSSQSQFLSIDAFAPRNRRSVAFEVFTERLKLQIPRTLVPTHVQVVRAVGASLLMSSGVGVGGDAGGLGSGGGAVGAGAGSSLDTGSSSYCTVCVLEGEVSAVDTTASTQDGTRLIKYLGTSASSDSAKGGSTTAATGETGVTDNEDDEGEEGDIWNGSGGGSKIPAQTSVPAVLPQDEEASLGVVSMGEVTLTQLKQLLESAGIKTEFRAGGILICAEQVVIRKDNNNFSIEGPPVKAFFEARRVLYNQFAFL